MSLPDHGSHLARERVIVVSAVAIVRDDAVLTVRKEGTERFMLVGGKPELGETPLETGVRETREEVGLHLDHVELLGEFVSAAANEPGHRLHSTVFLAESSQDPVPQGEIAELRWTPLVDPPGDIAPCWRTYCRCCAPGQVLGGSDLT